MSFRMKVCLTTKFKDWKFWTRHYIWSNIAEESLANLALLSRYPLFSIVFVLNHSGSGKIIYTREIIRSNSFHSNNLSSNGSLQSFMQFDCYARFYSPVSWRDNSSLLEIFNSQDFILINEILFNSCIIHLLILLIFIFRDTTDYTRSPKKVEKFLFHGFISQL